MQARQEVNMDDKRKNMKTEASLLMSKKEMSGSMQVPDDKMEESKEQ